jgi:hypothetical protein
MAGKRLYTEADVRGLPRGAELLLGPDAVATPSALDAAFERGVRVVHAAAGTSGPRAGGCGDCGGCEGCLRNLLGEDATYVVDVRAGRAVVTRLTDRGPVHVRTIS